MANLNSTLIKAFPAVNRSVEHSGDPYARHTSEQTVSSVVNKLIDTNGFVITKLEDVALDKPFAFNIYGYYFTVDRPLDIINLWDEDYWNDKEPGAYTFYAKIEIASRGKIDSKNSWWELSGQDVEETVKIEQVESTVWKYSAVDFTIGKPNQVTQANPYAVNNGWAYYIPLFDYIYDPDVSNRQIVVQRDYYMKFGGYSFSVDGGDLDV